MNFTSLILFLFVSVCHGSAFHKWGTLSAADFKCVIDIAYFNMPAQFSSLYMNFKTERSDNWNYESLQDFGAGVDRTQEGVVGGHLQYIEFTPAHAYVCIKNVSITCGARTNALQQQRSIVIDMEQVVQPHVRPPLTHFSWNREEKCARITRHGPMVLDGKAFVECESMDFQCINKHIK